MSGNESNTQASVYVTADLAKLKGRKLPTDEAGIAERLNSPSNEDLVLDNILLGRGILKFTDYFRTYAPLIIALRESLPISGEACRIAVKDGNEITTYTWDEFCKKFFGVSREWVRRQICEFTRPSRPAESAEGKKSQPKQQKGSRKDSLKAAAERIQSLESSLDEFIGYRDNVLYLIEQIEKYRCDIPDPLYRVAMELKSQFISDEEKTIPPGDGATALMTAIEQVLSGAAK